MNKCKLIFHTGYPKTATTYVQKYIQRVNNLCYLGCFYKDKNQKIKIPINKYHDLLFPPFRREVIGGAKNFTRNNFQLINNYAHFIFKQIKSNLEATHFVISDEKIGDFFNHMGEYNIFLVFVIGNKVKDMLKNDIDISLYLSNSIRKQDEFLWSFYKQHSYLKNNFSTFLEKKLKTSDNVISGLFYNECLSCYELLAGKNWNINFVPYEILSIDNNPKKLFKELFVLSDEQLNFKINSKDIINTKKVLKKGSKELFLTEKYYLIGEIGFKLFWGTKLNLDIAKKENSFIEIFIYKSLNNLGKFLLKMDKFISFNFPKKASIKNTIQGSDLILSKYKKDNDLLKLKLSQYDLDRYGY